MLVTSISNVTTSPSNGIAFPLASVFTVTKIGVGIDNDCFFQVIPIGGRIRLITGRRCRDVGDGVATLADIDGACQLNGCHATLVECTDGPQSSGRIVSTL